MKSMLEDLFYGEVRPLEQIFPESKEYRAISHKIDAELTYLKQKLSTEDDDRIDKLENLYSSSSTLKIYEGFTYGLKLGLLLTTELLATCKTN